MPDEALLQAYRLFPHAAIVTRLSDGAIVDVNESFERATGYSRAEILGHTTSRFYAQPEQRERLLRLAHQRGTVTDFEFRAVTKSGDVRQCQLFAQRFDIDGHAHLFSVIQDVTELRALQRELLDYADGERRYLARELHDGLAQDLAGVSYFMRSIEHTLEREPSTQLEQLRKLRDVIEKAIEKARALARGFSPVEMAQGGLAVSLYRLRMDVATIHDVEMSVEFHSSIELDETTAIGIYAIIHEAVTNAAKHARCKHIRVALDISDSGLDVHIDDDGSGMADGSMNRGMGIRLMKHRATLLGGQIEIESADGRGTSVRGCFDLAAAKYLSRTPTRMATKRSNQLTK